MKLHIYPKKLDYLTEEDYGDDILSLKYRAEIDDCEYTEDEIPIMQKLISMKNYINRNPSWGSLQLIMNVCRRNKDTFKIRMVPFPDDISNERVKYSKKFVSKLSRKK